MDEKWMLKIVNMALTKLPQECLDKVLDSNMTGTLDLEKGLLCLKTELGGFNK